MIKVINRKIHIIEKHMLNIPKNVECKVTLTHSRNSVMFSIKTEIQIRQKYEIQFFIIPEAHITDSSPSSFHLIT